MKVEDWASSEGNMVSKLLSKVCPVSRAAAAEMAERLLAIEAEVPVYKMLLWCAAGVMAAAVLITGVAWARARDMHNRTIVALTNNEKTNQTKIETARSACLEWQKASIKAREKFSMLNEELARKKKESASARAQVQLELSERLRLQMAYDQLREQYSKEVDALQQEIEVFSLVSGAIVPLAFQALEANLGKNEHQEAQGLLPRQ